MILFCFIFKPALAFEFKPALFTKLANSKNEVPEINFPEHSILQLDNGMIVYLAPDHSLPLIEIKGYLARGKIIESKSETGMTDLVTNLMLTASENYSEQEMARYQESNGLAVKLSAGMDRVTITANALKSDQGRLIDLLAEILRRPSFKGPQFNRTVAEYKQLYQQQFYDDSALLDMYFFKNIYTNHPYGYNYDYNLNLKVLKTITPKQTADFYHKLVQPDQLVLAISGDFKTNQLEQIIKADFADWKNTKIKLNEKQVSVNPTNHNKIILVNKPDATQAKLRMGYNFYTDQFAKKVPFMMGNRIFGSGSFNSRLMKELRSKKGYVYGINSVTSYHDYGGAYYINLSVKPANTLASIRAVKKEMQQVKSGSKPFSKAELFENINLYNAVFPRAYQKQLDRLDQLVYQVEIMGRSRNYLKNYIKQYNGLTAAEVQEIFAADLYPDIMLTVIVGPEAKILPSLKAAGLKVEVIN